MYFFIGHSAQICLLWNNVTYPFVGVLNQSIFPAVVGMGEVE